MIIFLSFLLWLGLILHYDTQTDSAFYGLFVCRGSGIKHAALPASPAEEHAASLRTSGRSGSTF